MNDLFANQQVSTHKKEGIANKEEEMYYDDKLKRWVLNGQIPEEEEEQQH